MLPIPPYKLPRILSAVLLACALLWGVATPVRAVEWPLKHGYGMLSFGPVFLDRDRQVNDGRQLTGAVGMTLHRHWDAELEGFFGSAGASGQRHAQFGSGIGVLYYPHRQPMFAPFIRGAAGVSWIDEPIAGGPKIYGELGTGFKRQLTASGLALRIDVTYRQTQDPSAGSTAPNWGDARLGVGLVWSAPTPPVVYAVPPPLPLPLPPSDGDGDGVDDRYDRCPETPSGDVVNPAGCPADTDMDGVPDPLDHCPNTPLHAVVDSHGCELDSDRDGVINRLDQCPGTPLGVKVDKVGCPIVKVIRLDGVHFHHDSDRLTTAAKSLLNVTAATLKENRGKLIEVAGHTDSRGSGAYNQALSSRRARSVRNYLVAQGVPESMLISKGYGESKPVTSNASAPGRAKNRRVELRIMTLK